MSHPTPQDPPGNINRTDKTQLTFNCASIGIDINADPCMAAYNDNWGLTDTDPYMANKKFNTPVTSGLVAAGLTSLIFDEAKFINVPIIGNVKAPYGMGLYVTLGTYISEYLEPAQAIWGCLLGYRRLGAEIFPPLYAGLASQGLLLLGGNNLGLDAFFIGAPSAHIGKWISNTYLMESLYYQGIHPKGLIPTFAAGNQVIPPSPK